MVWEVNYFYNTIYTTTNSNWTNNGLILTKIGGQFYWAEMRSFQKSNMKKVMLLVVEGRSWKSDCGGKLCNGWYFYGKV
jgi:hypothetical protein